MFEILAALQAAAMDAEAAKNFNSLLGAGIGIGLAIIGAGIGLGRICLLYTSPSPRDS